MLTSGGGFRLALPPAVGMRPPADGTELRFSLPADGRSPSQFRNKSNEWQRLVTKCFETLWQEWSIASAILPSSPPMDPLLTITPSAKFCIILSTFA